MELQDDPPSRSSTPLLDIRTLWSDAQQLIRSRSPSPAPSSGRSSPIWPFRKTKHKEGDESHVPTMPPDDRGVQALFVELKSRSLQTRLRAAQEIRNATHAAHRELPADKFAEFYTQLSGRLATLIVASTDPAEKLGGIYLIEELIDFPGEDTATKTTRFAGYLKAALRNPDPDVLINAARALGKLAKPGGALTAELVDSEIKNALEWLQIERNESRRFAAVLVISELAKNSPTLVFAYVPQILESVWSAIRDPKILIREKAAEAVGECFKLFSLRGVQTQYYKNMWKECLTGFKNASIEYQHGSLLIVRELLKHGALFMNDHYREACEIALQLKNHRELKMRAEVVDLIPALARYSNEEFCGLYLQKFMSFLSAQLKKDKERAAAFKAIGGIAGAIKNAISPYLENLITAIKYGLDLKTTQKDKDGAIFECLSELARATGQTLCKYIEDGLLDKMLACGLSAELCNSLTEMAAHVAPMRPQIQDKLLDTISLVLHKRPFRSLGTPDSRLPALPVFAKEWAAHGIVHGEPEIALALNILGSFDFKSYVLNEFVRDVAIPFLKNPNPDIRKAAATTSSKLYVADPIVSQSSYHAIQVVRTVITELLNTAISDPVAEIRRDIMQSLHPKFDAHLAEQENIRKIIMAIDESDFEVRKAAVVIIGRLTAKNPAYVFPPLRKLLANFTQSISSSDDPVQEEEGARLVSLLVSNASSLVRPFVENLVHVLVPKATSSNSSVSATSLLAIGDLATIGGLRLEKYLPQLMPTIIDCLQDLASASKRRAALLALGKIASNTGYVIAPYLEYPELLNLLTNIIKTEQQGPVRMETIKLLGVLGALDPYRHQQSVEQNIAQKPVVTEVINDVTLLTKYKSTGSDEFYPQVVLNTLMNSVLKDTSLTQYHTMVVDSIVAIFKTMGQKSIEFLPQIIPIFTTVIQTAPLNRLDSYFNQVAILVGIVGIHIRPYVDDLVSLILQFWEISVSVQTTSLSLIEALSKGLGGEFYPSIVKLFPHLMRVVEQDVQHRSNPSQRVLHTILVFGNQAERSMWLVIPKLVQVFTNVNKSVALRKACIETIGTIARQTNISDYGAQLLHNLRDALGSPNRAIQTAAYDCIITFLFQYPRDSEPFLDGLRLAIVQAGLLHANFDSLRTKIRNGEALPQDLRPTLNYQSASEDVIPADSAQRKLPVNQEHLKKAWAAARTSTKEDWQEWMRRFSIELLKESPSNALRACQQLATVYQQLARDLFNVAFISCWTELYDGYQEDLLGCLEIALTSSECPPEILQILLNLAEFMEHDDKPLPIDIGQLGGYAGKCHLYAKALHYKELEFEEEKTPSVVEALISINNQLQQTDAAVGILRNAQKYSDFQLKETWFEKLGRWEDALQAYEERAKADSSFEVVMGKMRCLHALGDWEQLQNIAETRWPLASFNDKRAIAPLAAAAAWGMHSWELMDNYLGVMKDNSPDRFFFKAIRAVNQDFYEEARHCINRARDGLDTELSALLGESYTRAYDVVVRVQMLAELEEIISYKKAYKDPEKQSLMRDTWRTRLEGCEAKVETWQRMLKVRQLVLDPAENKEVWIKYANLCRKSGRISLAKKAINALKVNPTYDDELIADPEDAPEVSYALLKYNWTTGDKTQTMLELQDFTNVLADTYAQLQNGIKVLEQQQSASAGTLMDRSRPLELRAKRSQMEQTKLLLSKCFLRLGQWQTSLRSGPWNSEEAHNVLLSYKSATEYNSEGYKAWHAWALANFEVINSAAPVNDLSSVVSFPQATITEHVVPAIHGFFRSIALSPAGSTLQDTLRLLTLWFRYGATPEVDRVIAEGFPTVNMTTWLEVIPQLIARINQPNAKVRNSVQKLLCDVGRVHPQALVYPLTVAMKSETKGRADSAKAVMDRLRTHQPTLVDQAQMVSRELIRVAVLWHEAWHEGLEEASRLYFGDNNAEGMMKCLEPLHKLLADGAQTAREITFVQAFARDLLEAKHWCDTFRTTREQGDLNQAWDLYYGVFKRITRQLGQLMTLDLQYVSPALEKAHNLQLAVPGTYQVGRPVIRIVSFDKIFSVFASKQRPRKMSLLGSDGVNYTFLLKGHEDIRQDERVMQLFGLVNTLLSKDADSFKRHLNIIRFPAIPLSQSSGLLGWIQGSDPLHTLIKDYRDQRNILLNIEHRIMLQMAPQYDNLTLMQKVEVFSYAMDNTTGKDLYRVLWLRSPNSEAWLERRTNYVRSLAVMSMVGYILGLGDRHPSNIMLLRKTGKIAHIDYGDCFEVAMHREKYPERVPFRLTRMLTYAMEVSSIDGTYKISCEAVMRLLRANKDSLMAVLEAFIHDPLVNWRLMTRESPHEPSFRSERRMSIIGDSSGAGGPRHGGSFMEELTAGNPSNNTNTIIGSRPSIRTRGRTSGASAFTGAGANVSEDRELQNERAVQVLKRVREKLTGTDFNTKESLDIEEQVARLIAQATNIENICQHYIGWCSFW